MVDIRADESDDHYDAYNDGWNKRITHHQLGDNPFGLNNWKYYEWEKGWIAADEAIKEENKE